MFTQIFRGFCNVFCSNQIIGGATLKTCIIVLYIWSHFYNTSDLTLIQLKSISSCSLHHFKSHSPKFLIYRKLGVLLSRIKWENFGVRFKLWIVIIGWKCTSIYYMAVTPYYYHGKSDCESSLGKPGSKIAPRNSCLQQGRSSSFPTKMN